MTKTYISDKQIKPKVGTFSRQQMTGSAQPWARKSILRWKQSTTSCVNYFCWPNTPETSQGRGAYFNSQSQQIKSQLLVCGTSERWNRMWWGPLLEESLHGWSTGKGNDDAQVALSCMCASVCMFVCMCCVHTCTHVNASCSSLSVCILFLKVSHLTQSSVIG